MATYLNSKKISWVNWNLPNKTESSTALALGAGKTEGWSQSEKFEEKHSSLTQAADGMQPNGNDF
ncbi:hypothetical protein B4144_3199 [Bacillus atrophaeus]|nr:hypothetical protein B4144_3199 [Bacillus atrophaeus]